MTKTDPTPEAIQRVRREISREFDNDPARLVEHYIELQRSAQKALVREPGPDGDVLSPDREAAQLGR